MTIKRGLAPVVDAKSRFLILGTLPCDASIRHKQYYADPRNRFWSLLASAFGAPAGTSYPERLRFLETHRVALWDVLESAERAGSKDSAIRNPKPNDFDDLFATFPCLLRVGFNGAKAEDLWRRHIRPRAGVPHKSLATRTLPSSSGSPGRYVRPYDEKLVLWEEFLRAPD